MAPYIVRAEYQADKTGVYSHEQSAFQFPDVWGEFDTEFKIFKVFVTTIWLHVSEQSEARLYSLTGDAANTLVSLESFN